MKKNSSPISEEKQPLYFLEQTSYAEWISHNGGKILIAFALLIFALVLFFRLGLNSSNKTENAYAKAPLYFAQWEKAIAENNKEQMETTLGALSTIIDQHPSLHSKYDGSIAQRLLVLDNVKEAQPLVENTLKRTTFDALQPYRAYSENTLLISQGKLQEAMAKAKQLQTNLLEKSDSTILYEFNLIRIASLAASLGDKEEESQAWKQWQNSKQVLSQTLNVGEVNLADYIKTKLNSL